MSCIVLILAAGASSRFGSAKALAPWGKQTLLSHALSIAKAVGEPLVVVGGHADVIQPVLGETARVFNSNWARGIGTSIAKGADAALALKPDSDVLIVMPVDQPLITSAHLDYLLQSARQTNHCAFTRDGEIWGPPAAIPRAYFAVIRSLSGEEGLKAGIKSENRVFCDAARMLYDIDTQEDLDRLNQAMKRPVSD